MDKKVTYVSHNTRVKEIIRHIESIGYKHGISTVFNDYLTIASCAVSNAMDKVHFENRETLYMQTIKKYTEDELQKFAVMHAMVVDALEQSLFSEDLLGEVYHSLNLSSSANGQFFTPMHIAQFMAEIMIGPKCDEIDTKGYITLCEPTCGSGVMVIAAANSLYKNHYNPSQDMCVLAVDNDIRCARMAYIQLSYLGIPAVVVHGDSLCIAEYERFYTPAYMLGGWIWRESMALTDGTCVDDEKLNCLMKPIYEFLKYRIKEQGGKTMDKYEEMLKYADRKYSYSELEKQKIISLLDYCHATDVRMTHRRMYEVFYKCDAMSGYELTTDLCNSNCARYHGCSNCAAVDDAECLINQEKTIFDFEPSDDFHFKDEVKSILDRYHGKKKDKLSETEIDLIVQEVKKELKCFNHCLGK